MQLWFKSGAWATKKARQKVGEIASDEVQSVAVIRHAALGDMVLTRPFLIELRRFFPNAKITLSVCSDYMRGVPEELVDNIHVIYGKDRRDVSVINQIKRARELGYHDFIFDLAATTRSFWVTRLNSAKVKVGFPYHVIQRIIYDITIPRSDMRFEAENMLEMLSALGHAYQYPLVFNMPISPVKRDRDYVVYFPGAAVKQKCWSRENYSDLIGRMSQRYPMYDHLVLNGISEWETIDDILAPYIDVENVKGLDIDDFSETAALIAGAKMLVCNDTGIRHVAIACSTKTVGIFLTPVFRYWPRYGGHEVAYTQDCSHPAVEQVYELACKVMAHD